MELAVRVDTDRAVRIGEQGFEVVEVAVRLLVDGSEPFGEGGRRTGELKDTTSKLAVCPDAGRSCRSECMLLDTP